LPRALEEAGAKVGDSITATRVASKPVTVEEIQEQPDGSKQTVRIDAKRNSWQVDNHGINREALIKAYDVLVKTPEDRKKLEISAPLLVAARDQVVVQLKREKLAAELNQRNLQNHTVRSHEIMNVELNLGELELIVEALNQKHDALSSGGPEVGVTGVMEP
jgi:hypothetical protein